MTSRQRVRRLIAVTLAVGATAVAVPAASLAGDGGGGPCPNIVAR